MISSLHLLRVGEAETCRSLMLCVFSYQAERALAIPLAIGWQSDNQMLHLKSHYGWGGLSCSNGPVLSMPRLPNHLG